MKIIARLLILIAFLNTAPVNAQAIDPSMRAVLEMAQQGDALSQNALGGMYEIGYGVPVDYHQALKWYLKAAGQGNSDAQNNLGDLYFEGKGVNRNYSAAAYWHKLAAKGGNQFAMFTLGYSYALGLGVPQSDEAAMYWDRRAAELGGPIGDAAERNLSLELHIQNLTQRENRLVQLNEAMLMGDLMRPPQQPQYSPPPAPQTQFTNCFEMPNSINCTTWSPPN